MDKRRKPKSKKRTKQAKSLINKKNRLNERREKLNQKLNNTRKTKPIEGKAAAMSSKSLLAKALRTLEVQRQLKGKIAITKQELRQVSSETRQRMNWLSEKVNYLEARYNKKGSLTDNQWKQYERYTTELRLLKQGGYASEKEYKGVSKYDEQISINDDDYGAILKKYHEYVDKGYIRESSILDKYEVAQWFKNEIMTQEEIEKAIEQADSWRATREEKARKRREFQMGLINF